MRTRNIMTAVMGVAAGAMLAGIHPPCLRAQAASQPPVLPHFDAASVKVAADQAILEVRPKRSAGRIRYTTQLWYLLSYAFRVELWRLGGDTSNFGSVYEIEATTNPKATDDDVRLMLQSLLADRFHMRFHRETKEVEGYALTVAKDGPKMQQARDSKLPPMPAWLRRPTDHPSKVEGFVVATLPSKGVGAIAGRRVTMLQFTETLQRLLQVAVLDQTGLGGDYYFAFEYATGDDGDVLFQSLLNAVEGLGLKLEKRKGPVEVLEIDHIEKVLTPK